MDTSLRYEGASKTLRLHAKEKFPLASQIFLQGHAEIDTGLGAPSYLAMLIRHLYPQVSASMSVGLQYDGKKELRYNIRGKKAFLITSNGLLNVNIKGRCDVDKEFREVCGLEEGPVLDLFSYAPNLPSPLTSSWMIAVLYV